jgi:GNAT superfamily N-acetyltransferase
VSELSIRAANADDAVAMAAIFREGIEDRTATFETVPANEAEMAALAQADAPVLVALSGGEVVGWVSVGPREDFPRIIRSPLLDRTTLDETGTWSVVCFWVPRAHRGSGVARALLDGAVAHARGHSARAVEGYPVDTAAERRPASSVYQGTLALFARAGFTVAYRRKADRPVVRRRVRQRRAS